MESKIRWKISRDIMAEVFSSFVKGTNLNSTGQQILSRILYFKESMQLVTTVPQVPNSNLYL